MIKLETEIEQIKNLINGAKTIAVVGHHNPDGDCIGCCVAMAEWLEGKGKDVAIFADGDLSEKDMERLEKTLFTPKVLDQWVKEQHPNFNEVVDDETGTTFFMMAAANFKNPESINGMVKHGASVYKKNKTGGSVLGYAALHNSNPAIVEALIKNGANINVKDPKRKSTVLMLAVMKQKNPKVIETLINHGLDVNQRDKAG